MRVFLCLVAVFGAVAAVSAEEDGAILTAIKVMKDCENKPIFLCLKERALHFIDSQQGDIVLSEGVQMVKTDDLPTGRSLDDTPLSNDLETRENEVDMLLVDRVARFFGTHTLQFKMPKDSVEEIQRSLDEARRRKKKAKRILMPLLLLLKLKAAALLPVAIGFLALIAFKALIVGKIALILSGIIGLKKLLEAKNSTQNYEIVSHPQYSHSASYDEHGGHYARALYADNLAYSAQSKGQ